MRAIAANFFGMLFVGLSFVAVADEKKSSSPPNSSVSVTGANGESASFDASSLAKLPQHEVHAEAHGKLVSCDGPNLSDVVAKVGAPQGEALRGKAMTSFVRVSGRDGYQVVFSLAELDPAMHDNVPILTAHCDGAVLDAELGPFRIVYPGEKRPARWVHQVNAIELMRAP